MEMKGFSARLRFLDESARLLSFGAPETSSFLEAQHDRLLAEKAMAVPESRRREGNGADGRIAKQKAIRKATKGGDGKEKVYVCSNCHSETRIALPAPKARMNKAKREMQESAPEASESGVAPVAEKAQSSMANVSSKKRAKARKGGLQAMLLANSKKESKPASHGFGLDLKDLMRSA